MRRPSQQGMALVITLIMLAAVTAMAVIFLGLSRRERQSVAVIEDLTTARLMADTALARAEAQIIANMATASNKFAYDLAVSTNFYNPAGFDSSLTGYNPTNVNYFYPDGTSLRSRDELRQNIANLFYDPRPPVFIRTNSGTAKDEDFRFFLDANRNGLFESNGVVTSFMSGFAGDLRFAVGDPEWIGVLEHPEYAHSATNQFIGRYAYITVPSGKTLDINYIGNLSGRGHQAMPWNDPPITMLGREGNFSYLRNQGVGSWEINLAAFFFSLLPTTNASAVYNGYDADTDYVYTPGVANLGTSFYDAFLFLVHRYNNNLNSLRSMTELFDGRRGVPAANFVRRDGIDGYGDGPLFRTNNPIVLPPEVGPAGVPDNPDWLWAGTENVNGFLSHQDFFSVTNIDPADLSFIDQVRRLSLQTTETENQYTFYRMMGQLSTDSPVPNADRINLNYDNLNYPNAVTFIPWTNRVSFFTNIANRILRRQYGQDLRDGIRVWPTNNYSSAVHRMLQVAANIVDATTNRMDSGLVRDFPTVFRPAFERRGTNIFLTGYTEATNATAVVQQPWYDIAGVVQAVDVLPDEAILYTNVNFYGVPLVVGAKKGFPNFNELRIQTSVQLSRVLQGYRPSGGRPDFRQTYEIGISNHVGMELWNSYLTDYTNELAVSYHHESTVYLRDARLPEAEQLIIPPIYYTNSTVARTPPVPQIYATWPAEEFKLPLTNLVEPLPRSEYYPQRRPPLVPNTRRTYFEKPTGFPVADLKLDITNRFWLAMVDRGSGRIVDFVNMSDIWTGMDIGKEAGEDDDADPFSDSVGFREGSFFNTNMVNGEALFGNQMIPEGLANQIAASTNLDNVPQTIWRDYAPQPASRRSRENAVDGFRLWLGYEPLYNNPGLDTRVTELVQVPLAATRRLHVVYDYQVDDPLVHYHLWDLLDEKWVNPEAVGPLDTAQPLGNLGRLNRRYRPWAKGDGDTWDAELSAKDPLVRRSDDWMFPTNMLPGIGWLGRVHRGTPWQTVYLKSKVFPPDQWQKRFFTRSTHPTNDWWLLDLFTSAAAPEAERGRLSVNQTNEAAWAAVLSGVQVLTNLTTDSDGAQSGGFRYIHPHDQELAQIVQSINQARLEQPSQVFWSLGHVLAAPGLSDQSPYLKGSDGDLNDAVYEWIPQQILSLLKEDEPFVTVYAYGQALKPADRSIVTTPGVYQGLCTNYQITGEAVMKAAVLFQEFKGDDQRPTYYNATIQSYDPLVVE